MATLGYGFHTTTAPQAAPQAAERQRRFVSGVLPRRPVLGAAEWRRQEALALMREENLLALRDACEMAGDVRGMRGAREQLRDVRAALSHARRMLARAAGDVAGDVGA